MQQKVRMVSVVTARISGEADDVIRELAGEVREANEDGWEVTSVFPIISSSPLPASEDLGSGNPIRIRVNVIYGLLWTKRE